MVLSHQGVWERGITADLHWPLIVVELSPHLGLYTVRFFPARACKEEGWEPPLWPADSKLASSIPLARSTLFLHYTLWMLREWRSPEACKNMSGSNVLFFVQHLHRDLLASALCFSYLHAWSLYVFNVSIIWEPPASIISSVTTTGNSTGFGEMMGNLFQRSTYRKLESATATTFYLPTARVIFPTYLSSLA